MSVKDGYSSPYVRVFFEGKEISESVQSFRYVYDEEDNDEIEIVFETTTVEDVDKPQFQEDAELTIMWGFIGSDNWIKRKVWIREPKWQFARETVLGTMMCTEKAMVLKSSSSKTVHKDKSLPAITKTIADKHNLKGYIEVPNKKEPTTEVLPIPGEKLSVYLERKKAVQDSKVFSEENRKMELEAYLASTKEAQKKSISSYLKSLNEELPSHPNVPQANKSDLQILKQVGQREKNGPWIVETRDDTITLKKRNFLKKPYRTYTYGDSYGELLEFTPESKNRGRQGSSSNVGFSGWSPRDKTFFSGNSHAGDGSPTLTKALEMLDFYKGEVNKGKGKTVIGNRVSRPYLPFINPINIGNKVDNAGSYTKRRNVVEITIDDKVSALQKAIDDYRGAVQQRKKELYSSLGMNPVSALDQASNTRRSSELKKNQVTATVWGDPQIVPGMIITIAGISKKYSGNYYILKATHTINKGDSYTVELGLSRQGHNSKINSNYVSSEELGRENNSQVGDSTSDASKKIVKTTKNPK